MFGLHFFHLIYSISHPIAKVGMAHLWAVNIGEMEFIETWKYVL